MSVGFSFERLQRWPTGARAGWIEEGLSLCDSEMKARCLNHLKTFKAITAKIRSGERFTSPAEQAISITHHEVMLQFSRSSRRSLIEADLGKHIGRDQPTVGKPVVENFEKAAEFLLEPLGGRRPSLTLETILQTHALLIGEPQSTLRNKRVHVGRDHTFPDPGQVSRHLACFIEDFNRIVAEAEDAIFSAVWVLFSFVDVHPFCDGNGRVARLLANLVLRERGVPFFVGIVGAGVHERQKYSEGFKIRGREGFALLSCHVLNKMSEGWRDYEVALLRESFAIVGGTFIPYSVSQPQAPNANAGAGAGAGAAGGGGGGGAKRAGKEADVLRWTCSVCTLINEVTASVCKVCENSRTQQQPVVAAAAAVAASILPTKRKIDDSIANSAAHLARAVARTSSCVICLDGAPSVSLVCCGKEGHCSCLVSWLENQRKEGRPLTCPSCRGAIADEPPVLAAAAAAAPAPAPAAAVDDDDDSSSTLDVELDDGSSTLDDDDTGTSTGTSTSTSTSTGIEILGAETPVLRRGLNDTSTSAENSDSDTGQDTSTSTCESDTSTSSSHPSAAELARINAGLCMSCNSQAAANCANIRCGRCCRQREGRVLCARHGD